MDQVIGWSFVGGLTLLVLFAVGRVGFVRGVNSERARAKPDLHVEYGVIEMYKVTSVVQNGPIATVSLEDGCKNFHYTLAFDHQVRDGKPIQLKEGDLLAIYTLNLENKAAMHWTATLEDHNIGRASPTVKE